MNKICFLLFFLVSTLLYGKDKQIWEYQHRFLLKKDQVAQIHIDNVALANKQKNSSFLLKFGWVLFENANITLLLNYKGYPHQYLLRSGKPTDGVKIDLLSNSNGLRGRVYALIDIADFDQQKQRAQIDVYIKDDTKKVRIKFQDPKQNMIDKRK
ncbi:hypothetical protein [Sulfurospirillum sp. 1612]|uniref:hypothetical protein n=1 Tax=Sulfurospirillum sp. 1612 TaxID=3094835 RepID=UPI002F93E5CF